MKIIQIDGFKGLITAAFIGICLFAGFVVFPGLVSMHLWNKYLVNLFMFPVLDLFQGVLLWGIIAISYCILSKKGLAVTFKESDVLSDSELDLIMKKAKIHSQMKKVILIIQKSDCFELQKDSSKQNRDLSHVSSPIAKSCDISGEKNNEEETVSKL